MSDNLLSSRLFYAGKLKLSKHVQPRKSNLASQLFSNMTVLLGASKYWIISKSKTPSYRKVLDHCRDNSTRGGIFHFSWPFSRYFRLAVIILFWGHFCNNAIIPYSMAFRSSRRACRKCTLSFKHRESTNYAIWIVHGCDIEEKTKRLILLIICDNERKNEISKPSICDNELTLVFQKVDHFRDNSVLSIIVWWYTNAFLAWYQNPKCRKFRTVFRALFVVQLCTLQCSWKSGIPKMLLS